MAWYHPDSPKNSSRSVTHSVTHQPQRTASRTRNGSSQSVYCGECTLFSRRKAHSIAPQTCSQG